MSVRGIVIIALAVVCGLSSALGAMHFRSGSGDASPEKEGTVPLLVATADIAKGQAVSADTVTPRQWPASCVPEGAVTDIEALQDRSALSLIVAGEPILQSKLSGKGAGFGLSSLIPEGKRAYTIQASGVASNVAGFVRPGNLVDVLLNLPCDEQQTGGGTTTTLLQAVEILAVDQKIADSEKIESATEVEAAEVSSVTLVVTPQQAALLDLGQNLGKLTLSLRNPEDHAQAQTVAVTGEEIRYLGLPPEVLEKAGITPGMPAGAISTREKSRFMEIRTLRGNQWGKVRTPVVH